MAETSWQFSNVGVLPWLFDGLKLEAEGDTELGATAVGQAHCADSDGSTWLVEAALADTVVDALSTAVESIALADTASVAASVLASAALAVTCVDWGAEEFSWFIMVTFCIELEGVTLCTCLLEISFATGKSMS
ncbi:hypothetical protein swp_4853 [Shewanella piezotolerans WP3]|uniref:Uncharacterized protein n=1 Tax=Shewanella piezotolerans (strain WP3 / JCM 13877) TaxID=225849 RepID=B8CV00_SHEPW|nr:hypothetical protein swp_4853 [Shewanella piezotolerans WP3]